MAWIQIRDADMNVGYEGGWCLKYVQDAYHTDHISPTATADWNRQPAKHYDLPPLGITVPVYFSLGNEPAGHIAIRLDDGWVASSTLVGVHSKPYYHKTLDDLIAVYGRYNGGCTYLGWGEYVGSVQVVKWVQDKSNEQVAQEVLDRVWGNEPQRSENLRNAGYDPATIQIIVNRLVAERDAREAENARLEAEAQAKAEQSKRDEEARQAELARQEEEARAKAEAEKVEAEQKQPDVTEEDTPVVEAPGGEQNVGHDAVVPTENLLSTFIKKVLELILKLLRRG